MTTRSLLFAVCLWSVISMAAAAQVKEPPAVSDAYGGFGLPDQQGARLLLMPDLARADLLKAALCAGGRKVPVEFERRQGQNANNGRQTTRNFDRLAGSVFAIVGSKIDPETPCFLASETLLTGSTVLSIAVPRGTDACAQRSRFATERNRPVINCWPLAGLGVDKQVALLEFERRGRNALAALVLVDGTRSVFLDYPAEYKSEGESLWRVDDDGKFSPDGFKVICALRRGNVYTIGTGWDGAEGKLLQLWTSDAQDRFTKVLNDYWYHAPTAPDDRLAGQLSRVLSICIAPEFLSSCSRRPTEKR
jgi:hypothetical protein